MENWKKCRFDFQTCLHSNQDYSETVKDISLEKIRHLENSILQNQLVPKLAPLPQGGHKKIREKCARLLPITVVSDILGLCCLNVMDVLENVFRIKGLFCQLYLCIPPSLQ